MTAFTDRTGCHISAHRTQSKITNHAQENVRSAAALIVYAYNRDKTSKTCKLIAPLYTQWVILGMSLSSQSLGYGRLADHQTPGSIDVTDRKVRKANKENTNKKMYSCYVLHLDKPNL